ncbi:WD40 repeat domain-containing protein [Chloropicon primus]|uniref:WD40 repeat domain-containing protein n=1 Tax=Chloropicon primus TaxID=1764295 RepID=A0A5B8MK85_9CHLO|nr:WD40 repeat domain-containing protein [Chloropicon primus]UPR00070.1 WD40 repeat domain-containing protein [Chloropicon primus]|mmetsp:Transcript_2823/g.7736  ORF Transcript_2823/g.7736 Transcript_2823/m.7736 type:complete len:643 (+) Transcript_2823:2200-4128(+)|eukprot:QDZ20857.1 WD40 repeat domain-containing protein [Chloropicon primus]
MESAVKSRGAMRLKKALDFMGLPPYASESQVRARYRELLRLNHPDKGGSPDEFRRVQSCYKFLLERLGGQEVGSGAEVGRTPGAKGEHHGPAVAPKRDPVGEPQAIRQGEEDSQQVVVSSDLKDLGDEAYGEGEYERAVEYYNAAAAYSRFDNLVNYAELLYARAKAHLAAGNEGKAVSDAKRSMEARPIWGEAYALAGQIQLKLEDWLGARATLEKALQLLRDQRDLLDAVRADLAVACKAIEEKFCVSSLRGHAGEVVQVSFLPESALIPNSLGSRLKAEKIIATASLDGTLRVWSCASGACLHTLRGHSAPISSFQWCPDGSGTLVSASEDSMAKIWQISRESCRLLRTIQGHEAGLTHVAFDKYGSMFSTSSEDGSACIWDLETGLLLHRLEGHSGKLNKGAFHPGGRAFVTASDDTTAKVWDLGGDVEDAGGCIHTLEWGDGQVKDVEYTPDGRFILMATRKAGTVSPFFRLLLFSSVSGRICRWFDGHSATITCLSWNPSQLVAEWATLATSSLDGTLKLWDIRAEPTGSGSYSLESDEAQGRALKPWEKPKLFEDIESMFEGALFCVAYSPDGEYLCAAGLDNHVRIFDSQTLEQVQDCCGHSGWIRSLAWADDGSIVVSASSDGTARIWNVLKP